MAQDRKLQKLELTWVGKYDEQQPLEPRILIENSEYSYIRVPPTKPERKKSLSGWLRLLKRVRSELTVERCKLAIKTLRSARTLKDSEHKLLELVLKLRLVHDHAEQGSNR